MRRLVYILVAVTGLTSVVIMPVAINLTDYRQDLLPYAWISFAIQLACILLVALLETRAFLARKKHGKP